MAQMGIKNAAATGGEVFAGIPVNIPVNFATKLEPAAARAALLGVSDAALAQRLKTELTRFARPLPLDLASDLPRLLELAAASAPTVIFLDSDLLGGKPLSDAVCRLAAIAPVLVLASINSQAEVAKLVALGNVEFIGRVGDYIPLAVALIERRVSAPVKSTASDIAQQLSPVNMGELFRHEINNPLTGILGNAELVLAHRENLSTQEVQRLQTVVDLAVRLRESIRRISNAWEPNPPRAQPQNEPRMPR